MLLRSHQCAHYAGGACTRKSSCYFRETAIAPPRRRPPPASCHPGTRRPTAMRPSAATRKPARTSTGRPTRSSNLARHPLPSANGPHSRRRNRCCRNLSRSARQDALEAAGGSRHIPDPVANARAAPPSRGPPPGKAGNRCATACTCASADAVRAAPLPPALHCPNKCNSRPAIAARQKHHTQAADFQPNRPIQVNQQLIHDRNIAGDLPPGLLRTEPSATERHVRCSPARLGHVQNTSIPPVLEQ